MPGATVIGRAKATTALAGTLIATMALGAGPAMAACTTSSKVMTCSGDDIPTTDVGGGTATTVDFSDVTGNFGPVQSSDVSATVYALELHAVASDGGDATKNKHEDGQNGGNGYSAYDLWTKMHFDQGYGIDSYYGAIHMLSQGGNGGQANEDSVFWSTAHGGQGGDGGSGGTLSMVADADDGGKTPYPITTLNEAAILLVSQGGDGGKGGKGTNQGGPHQGNGGQGGDGGHGGTITLTLSDAHAVNIQGSSQSDRQLDGNAAISAQSRGGDGAVAGEGLSDNKATGGTGGAGGDGGNITITATSTRNTITTRSDAVHGIWAVSAGGNGGTGGEGHGTDEGVGGNGGHGGTGGDVTVSYGGSITTAGAKSQGILVQSHGGAGGSGGEGDSWFDGNGGYPNDPGPGGAATVKATSATITTTGDDATAILVQSVGGFAGESGQAAGFVAYGASEASGGQAGAVSADLDDATLTTSGTASAGLIALSVGGGGGTGSADDGFVAMGAAGAAGGDGGTVDVALSGTSTITTGGDNAPAIFALSVGGGGGTSGGNDGVVALGGQGGQGGDGGTVTLTSGGDTTVATTGQYAVGVMVSSIGDGGGKSTSPGAAWALGANGGDGGDGGDVTVDFASGTLAVTTHGDLADGILISSVGGGGGHGGSSLEAIALLQPALGTSGGSGGHGGDITVTTEDTGKIDVETHGYKANGFVAQSIGGGGGTGGSVVNVDIGLDFNAQTGTTNAASGQDGGTISIGDSDTVGLAGQVTTHNASASGLLVQSVGGGGGSAGSNVQAGASIEFGHDMGTNGGIGGVGGDVVLNAAVDVTTKGHQSDGILAQSVGGGGGQSSNVVDSNAAGLNLSTFVGNQGSQAGVGGDAGKVTVVSDGAIKTEAGNSLGILAQSTGGGGGKAGYTVDADASIDAGSVKLGSSGGGGGDADDVSVTAKGSIETEGDLSTGILAQSVAGGGGQSGTTVGGNLGLDISYVHGGDAGAGGTAGKVTLDNAAQVSTLGSQAVGLQAQSIAGGGGAGGLTVAGALSIVSVSVAHGADGGTAGTAGEVDLDNSGAITTAGDNADGILAQSVGGAGGTAGITINGSVDAGPVSGAVNVSVGGDAGDGGTAGAVNLTNAGAVTTTGYGSTGITAQSIGGHGGNGGAVLAGSLTVAAEGAGSVNVTVGGDGGASGQGGNVGLTNNSGGDVTTAGHYATALFAQSVGGNGGKGGGSYAFSLNTAGGPTGEVSVAVGGSGGDSAVSGTVAVTNAAKLVTTGGNAHGIQAQSIGGNGGAGASGFAFGGDFQYKPGDASMQVSADVVVGGSGGQGAHANDVTVTNSGDISTATETSYGIYTQSVGGGGGDGGQAGAHSFGYTKKAEKADTTRSIALNFSMGGDQGASGDGKDVSVTHSGGTITTAGNAAYAIFAQSVGGGGGNSGNGSPGLKGWVADVANVGEWLDDIYDTYKDVADFPASLLEWGIDIGGAAGASGEGGAVTVENDGTLHTTGDNGTAIYAQSVGGGGGNGGDGSQGTLTDLTIARSGSGGGNGGDLTITNKGTIVTEGQGAMGIYAQSVGGGGGTGGDIEGNIVTALANFWETAGAEIFGGDNGGAGGDGGNVSVTLASGSSITTSGKQAHGVWLQTTGGGGGAGGSLDSQAITGSYQNGIGSAGDDGSAGYVNLTVDGSIQVSGAGAAGVFAQSASGSGGYSGGVKIYVNGSIKAEGAQGRGILAQASESGTDDPKGDATTSGVCQDTDNQCRGSVHIYVDSGATVEVTDENAYEAIAVSGGRTKLNSDGTIHYSSLVDNAGEILSGHMSVNAIANDKTGGLRIHNLDGGRISGGILLDDSNRTEFENQSGATFDSGDTVYLGKLGNYDGQSGGKISASGHGTIGTSTFSLGGSFGEAGTMQVDATQASDGSLSYDVLALDGLGQAVSAALTGTVAPNWTGTTSFKSGDTGTLTFATATNSASFDTVSATVTNSATMTYTLAVNDDKTGVSASYSVDYSGAQSGASLSTNASAYAAYFSDVMAAEQAAQSGQVGPAAAADRDGADDGLTLVATDYLNITDARTLDRAYRRHAPEEHLTGAAAAIGSALSLNRLLQSCPDIDPRAGLGFLRQGECSWAMGTGLRRHQDATDGSPEFDQTAWGLSIGTQREIGADLFLELAAQAETVAINGENFGQDGDRYAAGVALKKEIGRTTLSGTVTGGIYGLDYERGYAAGGAAYQANADVDGRFLGAELRASAVFLGQSGFYAKPSAALSYTQVWQDGFAETGAGGVNWDVDAVNEDWLAFTPAIELGRAFGAGSRNALAFVRAGVTMALNDPTLTMSSRLIGADASAGAFNGSLTTDRYQGDLAAGLEIELGDNLSLSLLGSTALSETSHDYGGSARIEFRF
ncbi:hypothetical protein [Marinibacterium sp. SX1]|uniref:hypothetical protein n=1 Tax=Marinibacterium sp. SX1 TaxID=3388424 RepID=UPI003D175AE9